jgi:uncharacterized membrane protein
VRDSDRFCGVCGTAQTPGPGTSGGFGGAASASSTTAGTARPGAPADPMAGLTGRNASVLCYIPMVGWIFAIVVLASARFRNDTETRFNAFQGLYLFVAWLIVDWVLSPFLAFPFGSGSLHVIPRLLKLSVMCVWIFMIVKTVQGQLYRLPILGELADRSVSEQR